ncbi:MAG: alcohol dehydrogenase catalytic domain-containing protein [Phycisphaerae bacterium]|nr:alcohol dehydrogenase catalytic domain-containing protein [Phycisphaerae bacterium]
MKAMMLTGINKIEMREIPYPVIKNDTDVLIRMAKVGVCGSDVHYYVSGRIGCQVIQYPYIVGHECSGVVEKVGSSVSGLMAGDRIAIDPAISCWQCDQCRTGRHHTCRKLKFLGCPGQMPGCLCEYIVMPEASCYKIKDGMTFEQAAISEPLSIGVYSVKQSGIAPGAKIGILGVGPIGLSVLLTAGIQGADKIHITDKLDGRIDVALNAGAKWAGNPDRQNIVEEITQLEPGGLDAIFECCGQQEALDQAIELLKPGGKLMLIGIPSVDRISFSIDKLRRKEISTQNVRRQVDCVQDALDMIDGQQVDVDFMATHHFPFEKTEEAFELVANYRDGVIKAIVDF